MMHGIEGKRIILAGSATGIGAATARRLVASGARVMLGDINEKGVSELAEELDSPWRVFDLADDDSIAALVDAAEAEFGGLDGLANIAADLSPQTHGSDFGVLESSEDVWLRTLEVDLVGYMRLIKRTLPLLSGAGGGSIVNISSEAAAIGEPVRPAYAAAKAGVESLTRHIATIGGPDRVRSNAIAPGLIIPEHFPTDGNELVELALSRQKLPDIGRPDDIASVIAFLLSDDSAFLTGQVLSVNGGTIYRQ